MLAQIDFAARGVVGGAEQVPLAGDEGSPEGELLYSAGSVTQLQNQAAGRVGPEGEAAPGVNIHFGDEAGPTKSRERGEDGSLEGEIAEGVEGGSVGDDGV